MYMKNKVTITVALFVVLAGTVSSAKADLKLEQTITTSGNLLGANEGSPKTKPVTTKTVLYYKNDKQRTEAGDTVTIYEAIADKYTVWDTKKKTYYEATTQQMLSANGEMPMADMVSFSGDATVTDTKEEKPIAGKTAHHYQYSMTLKVLPKDEHAPPALAAFLPSFLITGDQWTVETPETSAAAAKLRAASLQQRMPPGMSKGLKPLLDKLALVKGFPVEQKQSFKIVISDAAPQEMKEQAPKNPLIVETKTITLSEAVIADTVFVVPADYKKIALPQNEKPSL